MVKPMSVQLSALEADQSILAKLTKRPKQSGQIIVPADAAAAQFDTFKRDFEREAQDAERRESQAHATTACFREQRLRLESGLPEPHLCPNCWVRHGHIRLIVAGT